MLALLLSIILAFLFSIILVFLLSIILAVLLSTILVVSILCCFLVLSTLCLTQPHKIRVPTLVDTSDTVIMIVFSNVLATDQHEC